MRIDDVPANRRNEVFFANFAAIMKITFASNLVASPPAPLPQKTRGEGPADYETKRIVRTELSQPVRRFRRRFVRPGLGGPDRLKTNGPLLIVLRYITIDQIPRTLSVRCFNLDDSPWLQRPATMRFGPRGWCVGASCSYLCVWVT